ncbi:MAG: GDSL-type esterase/lipase family protein [Planctomycetota bacterium]
MKRHARLLYAVGLALGLAAPSSASATPQRILFLGDSVTQADDQHLSFRYEAFKGLVDSGQIPGVDFDFVGSWQDHFGGDPTFPDYQGYSFDRDHEGHWGWRTWQILEGDAFRSPPENSGTGKLDVWLDGYTPDVAFVLLGTNDISRNNPGKRPWQPTEVAPRVAEVVRTLQADNPYVRVILGTLIPRSGDSHDNEIPEFNALLPGVAADTTTDTSLVQVLDLYSSLDWTIHNYDGTHPNETGEAIIGGLITPALLPATPGDADRNGAVDLLDFDRLAQNFGTGPAFAGGAYNGDFNRDGAVDLLDFDLLAQHFTGGAPTSAGPVANPVPEPASLAALVAAGLWIGRRRMA